MKLFLRGLFALGVTAVFAFTASADTPAAPANAAPAVAASGGCSSCGTAGKNHRFGHRVDHVAESYIAFNDRVGAFFTRLAGPQVDPSAAPAGGKQKGGPHTQPGTVVFPQHPFLRSPRDFFMTEQP
jgi:hypothetical protein